MRRSKSAVEGVVCGARPVARRGDISWVHGFLGKNEKERDLRRYLGMEGGE